MQPGTKAYTWKTYIEESKKECMRDEVAVDDVMGMEWRFEDREKL
jgi:hypothetical protein